MTFSTAEKRKMIGLFIIVISAVPLAIIVRDWLTTNFPFNPFWLYLVVLIGGIYFFEIAK